MALPEYMPSSTSGNGKPIGFQRCVKADKISGKEIRNKGLLKILFI
jgi:hypothetical protein